MDIIVRQLLLNVYKCDIMYNIMFHSKREDINMSVKAIELGEHTEFHKKKYYLVVNSCGIGVNEGVSKNFFVRPHGTNDYQIILVMRGTFTINHLDEYLTLESNEMIIIPPNVKNEYRYNPGSYTMFIHFSGYEAQRLIRCYNFNYFTKYKLSDSKSITQYAEKIIAEMQAKKIGFINSCTSYLIQIITQIRREIDAENAKSSNTLTIKLNRIAEDMQLNYAEKKKISAYAELCNMSLYGFIHTFTEKFGISPYQYLLNIRISKASFLLSQTDISISEISHSVGYEDQFYFSRLFKKHTGKSPTQFRKKSTL